MAPDAVMGNRFIKLFWGNRDNIPINGAHSDYNSMPPIPPRGITVSSTLHNAKSAPIPTVVPVINGPKPHPPAQKKMENLEVLKEEFRKKQEMLDQKRNDFKRKLDKLAKQATTQKGEIEPEQVAKKLKPGVVADPDTALFSPGAQVIGNGNKSMEYVVPKSSKSTAMVAPQETPILKPSLRPLVPIGTSVSTNPFKLDNRPTAFKIISTLPNDLANVVVLKEHFSPFGDLSKIELDDLDHVDDKIDPQTAKYSARVYFTTRHSVEKAFSSGKCWNGHNLQFSWLKSSNRSNDGESPVSSSKGNTEASVGQTGFIKDQLRLLFSNNDPY